MSFDPRSLFRRLWPFARRGAAGVPAGTLAPEAFLTRQDLLRRNVEDVFVVRQAGGRGHGFVFAGDLLVTPARALTLIEPRFRLHGYTPFLSREGGLTWIQALPLAAVTGRARPVVNLLLFALTALSTLLAGWFFVGSPTFDALRSAPDWTRLLAGVPFAVTLLAILGTHEFGHYFAARHHGAPVSLPYFVPAPPPLFLFGTLGAVIRMRAPARDRNALFDIAVAGPLAGLAVAVPALVLGLGWSRIVPGSIQGQIVFGNSLLYDLVTGFWFGRIPEGTMLLTHPVADAAWAGLFVTALNLFPLGQLDGGRIAYALFGAHHRKVSVATFVALVALGLITGSPNWYVFAGLVALLIGFDHAPPLDAMTRLSPGRRVLGALCLLLLVLLVPPVPISLP